MRVIVSDSTEVCRIVRDILRQPHRDEAETLVSFSPAFFKLSDVKGRADPILREQKRYVSQKYYVEIRGIDRLNPGEAAHM